MDSLIWKIKNGFRSLLPLAIVLGVLYGGYHFYKKGTFRHGLVPGVTALLHRIPVLGSRFGRHSFGTVSRSESHGRRHGRSHHRGHRRHHRRH